MRPMANAVGRTYFMDADENTATVEQKSSEPSAENPSPASPQKTETVTGDDLIGPIVSGMPTPSDSDGWGDDTKKFGPMDSAGNVFDPDAHAVDEKGNPKTNKHGRFFSKSIGRPKKEQPAPVQTEAQIPSSAPLGMSAVSLQAFEAAAELYLRTSYAVASGVFQDDGWQPENDGEHLSLKVPLAAYLQSINAIQLPPGLIFALAACGYSGKRFTRPKTKEKLTVLWLKIRGFFRKSRTEDVAPQTNGTK